MSEPDRFAIVPIFADNAGCEVKFPGAIMTGSMSAVMARIKDSKQMREDLRTSNEADQVRRDKADLRQRERDLATREDSFQEDVETFKHAALQDFIQKLDALAARVDTMEQERAHDPDDDELPLPPGNDD